MHSETPCQSSSTHLSLESLREPPHVVLDGALVAQELDVSTVDPDATLLPLLDVLLTAEGSEAPLLGDDDLLATGELVLGTSEGLDSGSPVGVLGAEGQDDLANVDTGDGSIGLAESTTHTGLETIGSGARQHLVDTDDVVWVGADAEVEGFLAGCLHHVLVGANTGGFESLGGQLLIFVGDQVDAEGKLVDVRTLAAQVENADLGVGDTTVEARLGVWLAVCLSVPASLKCSSSSTPERHVAGMFQ